MRIAIAQLDLKIGAFDDNFEKIRRAVADARSEAADLVVLSELATVGYPLADLVERSDLVERNLEQLERIAGLTDDIGILCGFVDRNRRDPGKAFFNAAALLYRGETVDTVRKCLLPTYDVFDEARYFEPGTANRLFDFKGVPLGVTICEDAWSDPVLWDRQLYRRDPVREMADLGARVLINLSASPFTLSKADLRRDMIRRHAASTGLFFVYVNQVGANDELVFDGHSLIADGRGNTVVQAKDFEEDLLVYDIPQRAVDGDRWITGPVGVIRSVSEDRDERAVRALQTGLRDYVHKSGFKKVTIGLSGGIDSALVAAIAARALGPENVLGVAMPSRYSSQASLDDAEALATNLGIEFRVVSIESMFQASLDSLAPEFEGLAPDVTEENLQARLRGMVLMAFSNKLGSLVLATGNKSEVGVGYCTLYGDMCGAVAVISDVPKTDVYRYARWINRGGVVIPESTISKAPSAELRPDQTDQDSLPAYEELDPILRGWVEDRKSVSELVSEGHDPETVRHVVGLIDANEYKRRQAAPGIKISTKAFGIGRRYPIVADYSSLHR